MKWGQLGRLVTELEEVEGGGEESAAGAHSIT
jgi:hypothetical protein